MWPKTKKNFFWIIGKKQILYWQELQRLKTQIQAGNWGFYTIPKMIENWDFKGDEEIHRKLGRANVWDTDVCLPFLWYKKVISGIISFPAADLSGFFRQQREVNKSFLSGLFLMAFSWKQSTYQHDIFGVTYFAPPQWQSNAYPLLRGYNTLIRVSVSESIFAFWSDPRSFLESCFPRALSNWLYAKLKAVERWE